MFDSRIFRNPFGLSEIVETPIVAINKQKSVLKIKIPTSFCIFQSNLTARLL